MAEEEEDLLGLQMEIKEECDYDTAEQASLKDDEDNFPESEVLLGPKGQQFYYDGAGYYYDQITEDNTQRWLLCSHTNCGAKAHMDLYERAPIHLEKENTHNHQPNQARRERIRFLHSVKTRHATEDTAFSVIFQQELAKNPVGGSFFSFDKIEKHLQKKITQIDSSSEVDMKLGQEEKPPKRIQKSKSRGRSISNKSLRTSKRRKEHTSPLPLRLDAEPFSKKLKLLKTLQDIPPFKPGDNGRRPFLNLRKKEELNCSEHCDQENFLQHCPFKEIFRVADPFSTYERKKNSIVQNTVTKKISFNTVLLKEKPMSSEISVGSADQNSNVNRGNQYNPLPVVGNTRYLVCTSTNHDAVGKVALESGSHTTVTPESSAHSHHLKVDFTQPFKPVVTQPEKTVQPIESTAFNHVNFTQPFKQVVTQPEKTVQPIEPTAFNHLQLGSFVPIFNIQPPTIMLLTPNNVDMQQSLLKENTPKEAPKPKSEKVPSLFSDEWLFHDCNGHFYYSQSVDEERRYLRCNWPKCKVRAWMLNEPDAPINALEPHGHESQPWQYATELWFLHKLKVKLQENPHTPFSELYRSLAKREPVGATVVPEPKALKLLKTMVLYQQKTYRSNQKTNLKCIFPAEKVPRMFGNGWQYHDKQGFYYNEEKQNTTNNSLWLRCITKSCPGRAVVSRGKDEWITIKVRHNHEACLMHQDLCLFGQSLKTRVRDEHIPISVIYKEEAMKFPKSAAVVNEYKVKAKLLKFRTFVRKRLDIVPSGCEEDSVEFLNNQIQDNETASEILKGCNKSVYHNGRGYYFTETFSTDTFRFLICAEPNCLAQAKMMLVDGASIVPLADSYSHNHIPDMLRRDYLILLDNLRTRALTNTFQSLKVILNEETKKNPLVSQQLPMNTVMEILVKKRCYRREKGPDRHNENINQVEEEELLVADSSVEKLPSYQDQNWIFHDGRGYYFYSKQFDNVKNRHQLACCVNSCQVQAWVDHFPTGRVTRKHGSVLHNHSPDFSRRKLLLFLHQIVLRARIEHCSLTSIFEKEAKLDPEAAALIPPQKITELLESLTVEKYFKDLDDGELVLEEDNKDEEFTGKVVIENCELIYANKSKKPIYCNGKGYYYMEHRVTTDKLFLKCITPLCKAKAFILRSDTNSLIRTTASSAVHNHTADISYRQKLLFIKNCTDRLLNGAEPVDAIYSTEFDKDPIGALLVDEVAMKNFMYRLRKSENSEINMENYWSEVFRIGLKEADEKWSKDVIFNKLEDFGKTNTNCNNIPKSGNRTLCEGFDDSKEPLPSVSESPTSLSAETSQTVTKTLESKIPVQSASMTDFFEINHSNSTDTKEAMDDDSVVDTFANKSASPQKEKTKTLKEVNASSSQPPPVTQSQSECFWSQEDGGLVYHGGDGYVFKELGIHNGTRYLKCVDCKIQAKMELTPEYSPVIPMGLSRSHDHLPDKERLENLGIISKPAKASPSKSKPKMKPKATKSSVREERSSGAREERSVGKRPVKPTKYSDYVTFEEVDENEEALNMGNEIDDPWVLPEKVYENGDELHDGHGHHYQLVKSNMKRYLKCKNFRCKATVNLTEKDNPLVKLFTLSPSHNHPPSSLQSKRLSTSAVTDHSDESKLEENLDENFDENSLEDLRENVYKNQLTYYDGHGYTYLTNVITDSFRYLHCVMPNCKAQAYMAMEPEDAPINMTSHSPAHNHSSDKTFKDVQIFFEKCKQRMLDEPKTSIVHICEEESALDPVSSNLLTRAHLIKKMCRMKSGLSRNSWPVIRKGGEKEITTTANPEEEIKSELLPGFREEGSLYYDGRGYFFVFNAIRCGKKYLRCVENDCNVRGGMGLYDGAPITYSAGTVHNHPPDFKRRDFLLLLHRCRSRAVNETTPIREIYKEEAEKDPECASLISSYSLKDRMHRARRKKLLSVNSEDQSELAKAFFSANTPDKVPLNKSVVEDSGKIKTKPAQGIKSEMLPSIREDAVLYYDGRGYYFIHNNRIGNKRYLRCFNHVCKVRASMGLYDGAPIVYSGKAVHNHQPDFKRRNFLLLLERCKSRAVNETTPIKVIYKEETEKEPDCASLIGKFNVMDRMHRARRKSLNFTKSEAQLESAVDDPNEDSSQEIPVSEVEEEDPQDHSDFDMDLTTAQNNIPINELVEEDSSSQDKYNYSCVDDTILVEGETAEEVDESGINEMDYLNDPVDSLNSQHLTYCDEQGFSYEETSVKSSVRYLKCVEPGCEAKATMSSEGDSLVVMSKESPAHNHIAMVPEDSVDETMVEDYDSIFQPVTSDEEQVSLEETRMTPELTNSSDDQNEDEPEYPLKPGEVLPGLSPNGSNYHDGNGFYYELNRNTENISYLRCLVKGCRARAYMELHKKNAPIVLTNYARHNHGPDLQRKRLALFLQNLMKRAAEESAPINDIYQEEVKRDPEAASLITAKNAKARMIRFQKKHKKPSDDNEDAMDPLEEVGGPSLVHLSPEEEPTHEEPTHPASAEVDKEENLNAGEYTQEGNTVQVDELHEGFILSEVEIEMEDQQFCEDEISEEPIATL